MALMQRVRTSWSGSASAGSLSTHYFGPVPGSVTTADIQACVDRVRDFWTAVQSHIATGVNWTVSGVVDVIDDSDGSLFDSHTVTSRAGGGTLSGDPLPFQTQGLVVWQSSTIVDSHRLRGRTFVPAPLESDSTGGAPVAAYVTALQAGVTALMVTGTMNLAIWHRPIINSAGVVTRPGSQGPATGGVGKGAWAVLRSRR